MNALQFLFFEKIPEIVKDMKLEQQKENESMQFQEDEILALILANEIDEVRKKVTNLSKQFKVVVAFGMAIDALTKIDKLKVKTLKLYNLFKGLPQDIDNFALKLFTDKEKCLFASFLYLCTFIKTHKSISQFSQEVQEFVDKTIENEEAFIAGSIITHLKKATLENKYTLLLSEKLTIDCQLLNPTYTSQKTVQKYQFTPFKTKASLKSTVKKNLKNSEAASKIQKKGKTGKLKQSKTAKQQIQNESETEEVNQDKLQQLEGSVFEQLQKFKEQQKIMLGDYQNNNKNRRSQRKIKQDLFDSEQFDRYSLGCLQAYLTNEVLSNNLVEQQQELKAIMLDI